MSTDDKLPSNRIRSDRLEAEALFPIGLPLPTLHTKDTSETSPTHVEHPVDTNLAAMSSLKSAPDSSKFHRDSFPPGHGLSVPKFGNRIRRKSAPSMLEPIQEGLLGNSNRRNNGPIAQSSLEKKERLSQMADISESPLGSRNPLLSRRRQSDPTGLYHHHLDDKFKLFSEETRYPPPKRNSLVSANLDELISQFELLDRRKQVVEEAETSVESGGPLKLPPILITDS